MTTPPSPNTPPQPGWLERLRTSFAPEEAETGMTTELGRKRAIALLFVCLIGNGLGQTLMFAILPPLARDLGLTEFQVGSIFAVSATIWVFSSAFWGARSDRWGRRPVILIGLAAFGISTISFAGVMMFGLWGALTPPAPAAPMFIERDRTTPEQRTEGMATLNAAFGLGAAVGPGIGAALTVFGVVAPIFFVGFIGLASAVAIWLLLPERTAPHKRQELKPLSWRDPRVLPFVIFAVVQGTAGAIPIQTVAFIIRDTLNPSTSDTQQLAGVGLMCSAIASLFAQFVLVQRFRLGTRFLVYAGIGVALVSNLLVILAIMSPNYGLIAFALVLSGLGFGMLRPGFAGASSLAVSPDEQGAMAGLTGGAGAAGFIFAPLIGNALYGLDPTLPYILGTVLMGTLLVYLMRSRTLKSAIIRDRADLIDPHPPA